MMQVERRLSAARDRRSGAHDVLHPRFHHHEASRAERRLANARHEVFGSWTADLQLQHVAAYRVEPVRERLTGLDITGRPAALACFANRCNSLHGPLPLTSERDVYQYMRDPGGAALVLMRFERRKGRPQCGRPWVHRQTGLRDQNERFTVAIHVRGIPGWAD